MKGIEIGILKLLVWFFIVEERRIKGIFESNEEVI